MSRRPTETARGIAWVNNFPPEEQRAAELLINSLRVLSDATFRATLTEQLSGLVSSLPRPLGIYPVRELGDSISSGSEFAPLAHPYAPLAGSEGSVGHIVRDIIGSRPDESI